MTAVIPDEDPAREPTVCFDANGRHPDIPYEVMCWFMDQVSDEIRRCRAWMQLRPELVEVVHRLRQEYLGVIDDAAFPDVLAEVRAMSARKTSVPFLRPPLAGVLTAQPCRRAQTVSAVHSPRASKPSNIAR